MAPNFNCFFATKLNKMDVTKLNDFAFLFTVLAGAVQLTSLIFETSLKMYAARKRRIMRLLANTSSPYGKVRKAKAYPVPCN